MLTRITDWRKVVSTIGADKVGSRKRYFVTNEKRFNLQDFEKLETIAHLTPEEVANGFFILFFHADDEYMDALDIIIKFGGIFSVNASYGKHTYTYSNSLARLSISETIKESAFIEKTPLKPHLEIVHSNICQALDQTKNLEGVYLEVGTYKGGSGLTAINYMKNANIDRKSYFLDTFDGFNYDIATKSSDASWQGTHVLWGAENTRNLIEQLYHKYCNDLKFEVLVNNVCTDDLPEGTEKIAVANIDVDLYEATRDALIKIAPRVVKRGIIICEDPTSTPALIGAYYAMEKYLETDMGKKFIKIHAIGQYFLIKIDE